MNRKYIISFLFLFLLTGCEDRSFVMPFYEKILACLSEDHSYIEKVKKHRFQLSDDPKIFNRKDLILPHIVFAKDSTDLCSNVKVEKSWWNSLVDYTKDAGENPSEPSKEEVIQLIFSFCFTNHITGGKTYFDEDFSGEDALKVLTEFEKIGEKCGEDAIPIPLNGSPGNFFN